MPSLEEWQALGIVCGTIIAAAAVLRLAVKGVRRMWHLMSKASRFFDQVIGDADNPSLMQLLEEQMSRLKKIEQAQTDHLRDWHGHGGDNGKTATPHGPRPVPLSRGRRTG